MRPQEPRPVRPGQDDDTVQQLVVPAQPPLDDRPGWPGTTGQTCSQPGDLGRDQDAAGDESVLDRSRCHPGDQGRVQQREATPVRIRQRQQQRPRLPQGNSCRLSRPLYGVQAPPPSPAAAGPPCRRPSGPARAHRQAAPSSATGATPANSSSSPGNGGRSAKVVATRPRSARSRRRRRPPREPGCPPAPARHPSGPQERQARHRHRSPHPADRPARGPHRQTGRGRPRSRG